MSGNQTIACLAGLIIVPYLSLLVILCLPQF